MELTFNKVFTAEGEKNGKAWKRWDYKTADGQRYVSFKTGSIPLETLVTIELSGDNKIENWKASEATTAAGGQQETSGGWEAVRTAPTSPQGQIQVFDHTRSGLTARDTQIHRQTAAKVAAKLLDFFPEEEQSLQTFFTVSEQLVSYFATGDPLPF